MRWTCVVTKKDVIVAIYSGEHVYIALSQKHSGLSMDGRARIVEWAMRVAERDESVPLWLANMIGDALEFVASSL